MRRTVLPAVLFLAALPLGCGDEPKPPRNEPEVRLKVSGPADAATVRTGTATISGTVAPAAAHVRVLGRDVSVDGGSFSTDVDLEPGANLIDVDASAPRRRPDFAVLRVVYEQRVALPDVAGGDADSAQEQLEGLGLTVSMRDDGGFFDSILPGDPKVCAMDPEPGTQVMPGSEVTLSVARDC
jgi:hypothetical protein